MSNVIYTLSVCPNCVLLKAALKELGIEFVEKDMQSAESITDMRVEGYFGFSAPVLCIDGDRFYDTDNLFVDGKPNKDLLMELCNASD